MERNETATFQGSSAENSCSNNCQADQTALSVCGLHDGKKKGKNRKQNSPLNFPQGFAILVDKSESGNIVASSGDSPVTNEKKEFLLTDEKGKRNYESLDHIVTPHRPKHKNLEELVNGQDNVNEFLTNTSVMHPHSPIREGQIGEVAKKLTSDLCTGTDTKMFHNSEKNKLMCDRMISHHSKTHESGGSQEDTEKVCEGQSVTVCELNLANEEVPECLINTNCTMLEGCGSDAQLSESADIKIIALESQSNYSGFTGTVTNEFHVGNTEQCSVSLLACHTDSAKQNASCARKELEPVKHPQSSWPIGSSVDESSDLCDSNSPSLLKGRCGKHVRNEEMQTASWCPEREPTTQWNARSEAHTEPTDITPSLQISHAGLPHLDETHIREAVQYSHTSEDCVSDGSGIQRDTSRAALNKPVNVCISPPRSVRREGECDAQMSQLNRSDVKCLLIGAEEREPYQTHRFQPSSRDRPIAPMNTSILPMVDLSDATMLSQIELTLDPVNQEVASENMPGRNLCDVKWEGPSGLQAADSSMRENLGSSVLTEETRCVPITNRIQTETKAQNLDCSSDSDCTMISESEDLLANKSRPDVTEIQPKNPNLCPGPCSQNEMSNGNDNLPPNGSESETFSGIVTWNNAAATTTTTTSSVPNQGLQKRKAKAPKQRKRQSVSDKSLDCWKPWQLGKTFESPTDSPVDKGICSSLVCSVVDPGFVCVFIFTFMFMLCPNSWFHDVPTFSHSLPLPACLLQFLWVMQR